MLEFFQELTTEHIVLGSIVAIYLLGIFAFRFWCGLCSKPYEKIDDVDAFLILIWPLFIPSCIVEAATGLCRWLIKKFPKTSHELHLLWKKIVLVLDYATIPVRPFTAGKRFASAIKKVIRSK